MKQTKEHEILDDYSDTNNPLQSTIVAAFWSVIGIVCIVELIRFIVWIIKMI